MIKKLVKYKVDDPVVDRMMDNIENIFDSIFRSKIIDGVLISNVKFIANQDVVIPTLLGRNYKGWIAVDSSEFATFRRSPTVNKNPELKIILQANADTLASIWVF